MKDFNISTGLVVVPLAHLLLASTFLYAYCFGFGANIASFVAVTDIFTTSIRSIAPLYGLVIVAFFMSSFNEIKRWAMTGSPYPMGPFKPLLPSPFSNPLVVVGKFLLTTFTILTVVVDHLLGRPMDFLYPVCAILFSVMFSDWLLKARTTPDVIISFLVTLSIVFTLVAGFGSGQANRHGSFTRMAKVNSTCGNFVVLRRFSDLYLALGKDGQHRLIDKDCEPQFAVPRVRPAIKTSDLPKEIRWLFETVPVAPTDTTAPSNQAKVAAASRKITGDFAG